jgi:glycosyltransferase involved in cell wall biosynthesis
MHQRFRCYWYILDYFRRLFLLNMDLVMWAKNGAATLPRVLAKIEQVIPADVVGQKIFVDDNSTDLSVPIAQDFRWKVIRNIYGGISNGANLALAQVQTPFFASFEQDLLLCPEWYNKVFLILPKKPYVVTSGVRIPNNPESLRKIEAYTTEKYCEQTKVNPKFMCAKTIDNTIYCTDVIRGLGGFPLVKNNVGVDSALHQKVLDTGYLWSVNFNVVSTHLRGGLRNELKHHYWYGKSLSAKQSLPRALFSPFRAIQIAYNKRCLKILAVYPILRTATLAGSISAFSIYHSTNTLFLLG